MFPVTTDTWFLVSGSESPLHLLIPSQSTNPITYPSYIHPADLEVYACCCIVVLVVCRARLVRCEYHRDIDSTFDFTYPSLRVMILVEPPTYAISNVGKPGHIAFECGTVGR